MHRSHLPAKMWFVGAAEVITRRAAPSMDADVMIREMANYLGVHYEAGWRMKQKLLLDLSPCGEGLVREAICVRRLSLPGDMELGEIIL